MSAEWLSIYRDWQKTGQVVEEQAMFQYIQKRYPKWIARYGACLQRARQTVLKKTVEGFLRENIGGMAERLEPKLPSPRKGEFPSSYRFYPVGDDQWMVFPIERRFAFDRDRLDGEILLVTATSLRPVEHVVEWLALVYPQLAQSVNSHHWGQLVKELCNAGANQALAYLWQEMKSEALKQQAEEKQGGSVQEHQPDPSLDFEAFCVEGHHLHPCAKTKLGLTPAEVDRYSPECQNQPSLCFVAVQREWVESTWAKQEQAYHDFLLRFFPELAVWVDAMGRDGYLLLPVHEWQLQNVIPEVYRDEIHKQIVVPLPGMKIPAYATTSFRTLLPIVAGRRLPIAVKVAVNSQMTSTIRSISPQTTINSKPFSWLMEEVINRETQLKGKLVPINELGGCCFKSADPLKKRNLSVVFREVIRTEKDEVPIVASALTEQSLVTGKPMVVDILAWYATTNKLQSMPKAAKRFLAEYIRLVLSAYLPLMVKYGIGLEGHMQNSIPVFRRGRPVRLMVRDWGGARIYQQRLRAQGIQLAFYPHSLTVTDKLEKMQEKVFYTVYQSHLGELILQLSKEYALSEAKLWQQVGTITEEILEQIAQESQHTEAVQQDRSFLFQPKVPFKALTTMRLFPDCEQYIRVTNPLAPQNSCLPT